jgi:site-specific recombinase XerD
MRIPDALARFLVQLQADGRSPHTVAQYERHVRRFGAWLEAEGLPDDAAGIDPEHIARFLASAEALRRPDGRSKRTGSLNALRSSLRGFCAFLETSGLVERSPAGVLRMARVGATPPKGLRPDEVAALLAVLAADETVAGRRDHALFSFLLGTGARLGSALALLEPAPGCLRGSCARLAGCEGKGTRAGCDSTLSDRAARGVRDPRVARDPGTRRRTPGRARPRTRACKSGARQEDHR